MNERIKQLAEQAGFGLRRDGEIYTSRLEHLPITEDLAKFAELILEEIMQELIINGHDDAFIFLNKHFGVEE